MIGIGRLFTIAPTRQIDNGIALHSGIAKGVRIIDNYGNPTAALVVDGLLDYYIDI